MDYVPPLIKNSFVFNLCVVENVPTEQGMLSGLCVFVCVRCDGGKDKRRHVSQVR